MCLYLTDDNDDPDSTADVLYFAPDWGVGRWLARHGRFRVVTTDLGSPGVDLRADITQLPLRDASFDLILCSHVLEHVPHDAGAIAELFRVLRPGGTALVQVPYESAAERTDEDPSIADPRERVRRFGQFDHVRLYGRDFVERLRAPGFEVQTVHVRERYDADEATRLGLWDDPLFVCQKPINSPSPARH
jgi:SAM-dependent methyltransferase